LQRGHEIHDSSVHSGWRSMLPLRDLLDEVNGIGHANAKLARHPRRKTEKLTVHGEKNGNTGQLCGRQMKGVEALEALCDELIDANGQIALIGRDSHCPREPEGDRLAAGLVRIQAVLKDEGLALERLDDVRRKGKDTEHSLGLKPDKGLLLKVKGPLEAAEIEVDAHDESLPKASGSNNSSILKPRRIAWHFSWRHEKLLSGVVRRGELDRQTCILLPDLYGEIGCVRTHDSAKGFGA
ncbi:MAG: hypothetical protein ABIS20_00620, partial [Thermoanaerobaculia bacterium]